VNIYREALMKLRTSRIAIIFTALVVVGLAGSAVAAPEGTLPG